MKKLICLALCLLLVCTVSIARAEDESSACSHSYGEGIVTAGPTCGQAGVRTYTCTLCGNTKTESIPAAGEHSWNGGSVTAAPTCQVEGVRTFTCTVCNKEIWKILPLK